ncbi:Spy/CpxP family protein refolding chaperone [Marinobacterium arenosum]|uniref:Spy/CpxP family protein refolding chaperone n=1 Tax=Marinobacterium arenosum TaxID=2862496 RepID=UPI001C957F32|nr:Spy/CpxP family protein refolding chaperone [Marinobacterium arenosum]MBY4675418.1 Spy/CpxP family protein refolding chaperone [Marinobacterium arenosum]
MRQRLLAGFCRGALIAAWLVAVPAQAHGPGMEDQGMMGGHAMGGFGMMDGHGMMWGQGMMGEISPYMAGALDLSDKQQAQIADIQRRHAREHWDLMQSLHGHGQKMMELYGEDDPEPKALREAYMEMSEVHGRMIELMAQMHREMHGILTEEQRQRHHQMRRYGDYYRD